MSDFVQASVHPVLCSPARLVKLSKTLHLSSDFSCKMNRIMVNGKHYIYTYIYTYKVKAIPLQALTGPEVSWSLRLPDFKTIGIWKWKGCQP
jgi:hypothetical protein